MAQQQTTWHLAPPDLVLSDEMIHVWRIHLPTVRLDRQVFEKVLSAEERGRASRFRHNLARDFFLTGRGALRILLGQYIQCAPEAIEIRTSSLGKPYVRHPAAGTKISFSLSHSGEWLVLAFGNGRSIGIDIELHQDGVEFGELAARFFTAEETRQILCADEATGRSLFFRLWVGKEAYLKALGVGLSSPLNSFTLPMTDSNPSFFACELDLQPISENAPQWMLYSFCVQPGYTSALVSSLPATSTYHLDWR